MMWKKILPVLAIGIAFVPQLVASAESTAAAPMFGEYKAKGFLTDYAKIPTTAGEEGAYKYRDPAVDLGQ